MIDLLSEWKELTLNCNCDESVKLDIFNKTHKKYSSKKRFYHNTKHIEALLKISNNFKNKILDLESVKYSIWFHDVIYQAWKKDNEEQSAKFAIKSLMSLGLDKDKIDKISRYILLTKDHSSYSNEFDESLFLDSDLSILGVSPDKYLKYTENIRKEYFFVPSPMYKKGRTAVLNHFLEKDFIYKTEEMRDNLEAIARNNLKAELDLLQKI